MIERDGALLAKLGLCAEIAMRQTVVQMPTIAPRGAEADTFRLQDDDFRPRFCQLPRGCEPGKARADDGDIVVTADLTLSRTGKSRCRIMPLGDEFHRPCLCWFVILPRVSD